MKKANLKIIVALCLLIGTPMLSQSVSGKVTSKTGPIPGVNVLLKGSTNGTQTDFEGNFKLNGTGTDTVLIFSYLGFKTQEIDVGNKDKLNIILEEVSEILDEVVLIGYGQSQDRRTLSTAVATVSKKQLEDIPAARVETILQGAAAGVVVQQDSGAPGASSTIRIRGVGSPNASDPLYVVDGFPVPDLQHLNPNDIQELVILKDAASTAIYGSRGNNGVILVKTKTGKRNSKPVISINGYAGFQTMGYKPNLMNSSEYINYYNQGVVEANGNLNGRRGLISEAESNVLSDTDWYEAVAQNASMSNLTASLSDGGENYAYSFSGGNFEQAGIFNRDGKSTYNRKNISASLQADIRKNFKINLSTSIAKMTNSNPVYTISSINALPSIYPRYAENGEVFNPGRQSPSPIYNGVPLNIMGEMTNPLWELNGFVGNEQTNEVTNYAAAAEWQPLKDLHLRTLYSFYKNDGLGTSFSPSLGAVYPTQDFYLQGQYSEGPSSVVKDQVTATAAYTFSKLAEQEHHLDVLLGFETLEETTHYGENIQNTSDYLTTDFSAANFALATDRADAVYSPASINERGLVSLIARVKYDFKEKYLATASIRNDQSSTFGTNYRSGNFPSFSLGWVLSEEAFLQDSDWVNMFKIRTGWGISGIDSSQGYAYLSTINSNVNYGQNSGLTQTRLANPNLKWEELQQFNMGLDLQLFKNALSLTLDYYNKETTDILLEANTPESTGLNPSLVNIGGVQNSGVEVGISYKKISTVFSWNASLNLGYNKNEVTNLGNNGQDLQGGFTGALFSDPITLTSIGHPIGSFYGYVVEGMDMYGNLLFEDLNNSGNDKRTPDPEDKTFIGKPLPDITAGLNLGAKYKGFDISTFLYAASGNDVFDATIRYTAIGSNRPASYLQEGAPRNMAVAASGDSNGENLVSDFHVKDASFIKLKNIVIGYTLPENIIRKLNTDKIRIYISGQNLHTFTNFKGVDPEVGGSILSAGIDTGFYPQSRSYLLGFQINI